MFWNWLYFDKTPPNIPADAGAEWKRGEYIVNGLGHCAACHTPKTILFGDITSKPLAGGVVDHWFANNLTGGQAEGMGQWRHDEVVKFLATGINAPCHRRRLDAGESDLLHQPHDAAGPRRHRHLSEKPAAA